MPISPAADWFGPDHRYRHPSEWVAVGLVARWRKSPSVKSDELQSIFVRLQSRISQCGIPRAAERFAATIPYDLTFSLALPACFWTDLASNIPLFSAIVRIRCSWEIMLDEFLETLPMYTLHRTWNTTGIRVFCYWTRKVNLPKPSHKTSHSRHGNCTEQASQHSEKGHRNTFTPKTVRLPNSLIRSAPLEEAQRKRLHTLSSSSWVASVKYIIPKKIPLLMAGPLLGLGSHTQSSLARFPSRKTPTHQSEIISSAVVLLFLRKSKRQTALERL